MEVAKITSKGQITIPIEIRKKLKLKEGNKIVFLEKEGKYYIENSDFIDAVNRMQDKFKGESERLNLKNEQDVVDMVKEIRKELWEEKQKSENNA